MHALLARPKEYLLVPVFHHVSATAAFDEEVIATAAAPALGMLGAGEVAAVGSDVSGSAALPAAAPVLAATPQKGENMLLSLLFGRILMWPCIWESVLLGGPQSHK